MNIETIRLTQELMQIITEKNQLIAKIRKELNDLKLKNKEIKK